MGAIVRPEEGARLWRRSGTLLAAVFLAVCLVGCGESGEVSDLRLEGWRSTYEGSYQVKAVEAGRVLGVGIYDRGSFRVILEGSPRLVIYNHQTGESWMVNFQRKTFSPLTREKAIQKASFMPHLIMKAYFDLEEYWEGGDFVMEGEDGSRISAGLGDEGFLPLYWEASQGGRTIKRIEWQYRRVGSVSPDNFLLPEGFSQGST